MKIDGKKIALKIYSSFKDRVGDLKKNKITPHLVVILIGDNPASIAYVKQKQIWGEYIGAKITILKHPSTMTAPELINKIKLLNSDPYVHAILIQRPIPPHLEIPNLDQIISPQKDIDGFHSDSPHTFPIPLAVIKILEEIFYQLNHAKGVARMGDPRRAPATKQSGVRTSDGGSERQDPDKFISWLHNQKIVVIGKGATGGAPILKYLRKLNTHPTLIDSKTPNPTTLTQKADIIISAVGKPNIINSSPIKKGVILIGVGIYRGEDGKLHGDYDESDIEKIASYYTPTPGGVGPINVAMLMKNLLNAVKLQTKK